MARRGAGTRRASVPLPTRRGWAVGGVGVVALLASTGFQRSDLLFVGFVLALAVAGSILYLLLTRPRLSATRAFRPDAVTVGEDSVATVEVQNESPWAIPVERWRDALPDGVAGADARAPRPVPVGHPRHRCDAVVMQYLVRPRHRGLHQIGPLLVRRTDPLGLATAEFAIGATTPLLAMPPVTALEHSGLDESASEGTEQSVIRHSLPSADEVAAREYQRGDPLRRVHWHATAKRDRLMVRQEEQRSNPQAWILFDTVRARGPAGAYREQFERAVELVASLASHTIARGYVAGIVETGQAQLRGRSSSVTQHGIGAAYENTVGERMLVAELGSLQQVSDPAEDSVAAFGDALRRAGTGSPAYAVLVDSDPRTWRELAGLRALAEPAVAFLASHDARSAGESLAAAGWVCVELGAGTTPAEAWRAAGEAYTAQFGASRV